MIAIAYASEAAVPFDQQMLQELYDAGVKENRQRGLTGYLSFKNGRFFQYPEGTENAVNGIPEEINNDSRHTGLRTLQLGSIEYRRFSQWSMLNISGAGVPDIRIQDLIEDVIKPGAGDAFDESESTRIMLEMLDQMSKLQRGNHKKAQKNNVDGIDIGEKQPFVVVFGASAGGLYPLQSIVRSLKPNLNAAFIVIQHFSPETETMMDMILQRDISMKVCSAAKDMKIQAGSIYVIPPGKIWKSQTVVSI